MQPADIDELVQESPIDHDDLIEIMTINENRVVNMDKHEDERSGFKGKINS